MSPTLLGGCHDRVTVVRPSGDVAVTTWLDDAITDSPIVKEDTLFRSMLGVMRQF